MKVTLKALLAAAGLALAGQAVADITLYQDDGFHGRQWTAGRSVENFANRGLNDAASSARVRGEAWEVCTDAYFEGRCIVLRPGNYPSLGALGLNDKIGTDDTKSVNTMESMIGIQIVPTTSAPTNSDRVNMTHRSSNKKDVDRTRKRGDSNNRPASAGRFVSGAVTAAA